VTSTVTKDRTARWHRHWDKQSRTYFTVATLECALPKRQADLETLGPGTEIKDGQTATSCTTWAEWTGRNPTRGTHGARSFDDSAREVMTADPAGVPELQAHQYFSAAVPTPDHFIPLLYLAGLAASDGNATEGRRHARRHRRADQQRRHFRTDEISGGHGPPSVGCGGRGSRIVRPART
jgi:hypothetical protein